MMITASSSNRVEFLVNFTVIEPVVDRLEKSGMWISEDIRRRILALARES